MGFCRISARALMAARPTRSPVNDPGPETTMKAPMSALLRPCVWQKGCDLRDELRRKHAARQGDDFHHLTCRVLRHAPGQRCRSCRMCR